MRFLNLLSVRLFIVIFIVMVIGTGIVTTIDASWQSQKLMEGIVQSSLRTSDIIKRSAHYSMLLNRREDTYHIIKTIGTEPGVHGIRIYDKRGIATFSTDSAEVGHRVDMRAEACNVCHLDDGPPISPNRDELTRIFPAQKGYRVLGTITPIYNESSCAAVNCHPSPSDQTVLGVLDVMLSLEETDAIVEESYQLQYLSSFILIVIIASISGIFLLILVKRPVKKLTQGTQEIIKGNLKHRINVQTRDEIGMLARSFNKMTDELERARTEIMDWTQTLESRVAQKTEELQRAQNHLIHVEKMASLGKLAATVTHEINNPIEGILTYAKLLKKKLIKEHLPTETQEEIQSELSLIADEASRCGSIVNNLLLFARRDIGSFRECDVRVIAEKSLKLIEHHLEIHDVRLEKKIGEEPAVIQCDPDEIEQALLALEINAIDAMPDGGTLGFEMFISPDKEILTLIVRDNGIGIPQEHLSSIFEPFFTTKEVSKATGLGLAVVFGIVERHFGKIRVESKEGFGSTFTIELPLHPPSIPRTETNPYDFTT